MQTPLVIAVAALLVTGCSSGRASEPEPAAAEAEPSEASDPASPDPSAPPRIVEDTLAGAVVDLEPGMLVRAELERGDHPLVDESLGDDYALTLDEGEVVTILVRGGRSNDEVGGLLDMQAFLLFNGQEVLSDDDGATDGDARNARIVFSPPVRGFYVLRATTSGPGMRTGPYEVQVYPGGHLLQH